MPTSSNTPTADTATAKTGFGEINPTPWQTLMMVLSKLPLAGAGALTPKDVEQRMQVRFVSHEPDLKRFTNDFLFNVIKDNAAKAQANNGTAEEPWVIYESVDGPQRLIERMRYELNNTPEYADVIAEYGMKIVVVAIGNEEFLLYSAEEKQKRLAERQEAASTYAPATESTPTPGDTPGEDVAKPSMPG